MTWHCNTPSIVSVIIDSITDINNIVDSISGSVNYNVVDCISGVKVCIDNLFSGVDNVAVNVGVAVDIAINSGINSGIGVVILVAGNGPGKNDD
jgi:hypothetical protein